MFEWLLGKKKEAESETINVGLANVVIKPDEGDYYHIVLKGSAHWVDIFGGFFVTTEARERVKEYLESSAKKQMFKVSEGCYIPYCKIECVKVSYEPFEITLKKEEIPWNERSK